MSTLLLRSPDFGNTFKFVANTRMHRTLNNDLRSLQGDAPTWQGFHVHFSALSKTQIDTFRTYVITNAGQLVTLKDFENRIWVGVITSSRIPIFKGRRHYAADGSLVTDCDFSTEFEFEGQVSNG